MKIPVKDLMERLAQADPDASVVIRTRKQFQKDAMFHDFKVSIVAPSLEVVIIAEDAQ